MATEVLRAHLKLDVYFEGILKHSSSVEWDLVFQKIRVKAIKSECQKWTSLRFLTDGCSRPVVGNLSDLTDH